MIEEVIKGAGETLNQYILGTVLLVTWVSSGIAIKVLWDEVKSARAQHQAALEKQVEDIRNLAHVASSVEGLKTAQEKMQTMVLEILTRRAG